MGELTAAGGAAASRRALPLAELVAAVGFLTRVPVAGRADSPSRTGAAAFGLVGLAIGVVGAIPLPLGPAHPWIVAIVAIALVALVDGGLHLDGLADTFDALVAPPGSADRARGDPRAGTAGVIAIVVTFGIDVAALAELTTRDVWSAAAALIAAVAVSRTAALVWAVLVGRRLARTGGLGTWFAERTSGSAALVAVLTTVVGMLVLVELTGPGIVLWTAAGTVVAVLAGAVIVRLRGQLDGDGYGALIELTVAAILVASAVIS